MSNEAIRRFAAGHGVKLWQVAEALGMADTSLSRKMRRELSQEDAAQIVEIIKALSEEVE